MPTVETIPGAKVLLMGASGTGKTYSIRSWPKEITPFIIFTEPGMEVVSDLGCDRLHWKYIPPTVEGWATLLDQADKVLKFDFENLLKIPDPTKMQHTQFYRTLQAMQNFTCDRCGKSFGDVTKWNTDRVLVLDSLSGLSDMAMQLVVGSKVVRSIQDWMIVQNMLEATINKLVTDCTCFFQLIAHIEREKDEITGGTQIMVSSPGRKLSPKLPKYFSDAVLAVRAQGKWFWSTTALGTDLKTRNLEYRDNLDPTFKSLVTRWLERGGKILPTTP